MDRMRRAMLEKAFNLLDTHVSMVFHVSSILFTSQTPSRVIYLPNRNIKQRNQPYKTKTGQWRFTLINTSQKSVQHFFLQVAGKVLMWPEKAAGKVLSIIGKVLTVAGTVT
jgi:hypothetical protein